MNVIFFALLFLVIFITVELIQRWTKMDHEYSRKLAHFLSGVAAFFMPYFLNRNAIVGLAMFFVLFLMATRFLGFFQSIHKVGRRTFGEVYFPAGIGLVAYFFLPDNLIAFQFGALVLGLSDAIGGLVGSFLGHRKTKLFGNKSVEGTAAFFLTTFLIFLLFVSFRESGNILSGILLALIITTIELALSAGLDNLFLPVLSALFLKLLTGCQ
jgi:dolichol kinase